MNQLFDQGPTVFLWLCFWPSYVDQQGLKDFCCHCLCILKHAWHGVLISSFLWTFLISLKQTLVAFLTFFLALKYWAISLLMLNSPLHVLLHRTDWMVWMCSFVCSNASLAVAQISSSLRETSNIIFTLFSWQFCWLLGNRSNSSTQSNKLLRPLRLWPSDEVEVEAVSEDLNLHKCLSNRSAMGWGLDGKLRERAW